MAETRLMKSVAQASRGRTSPTAPTHGVAPRMTQTSLHNRHKHGPQQKACLWSLDRPLLRITRVTHKLRSYMCSDFSENVIYTRSWIITKFLHTKGVKFTFCFFSSLRFQSKTGLISQISTQEDITLGAWNKPFSISNSKLTQ